MIDGVGGSLFVFQRVSPDIKLAPRILDLGASACTCGQLAHKGKKQGCYEKKRTFQTHNGCKGTNKRVKMQMMFAKINIAMARRFGSLVFLCYLCTVLEKVLI